MEFAAIFESWHIGDGNYPPLHRGQRGKLSFELIPQRIETSHPTVPDTFRRLSAADHRFCGTVLGVYETGSTRVMAVEAQGARFHLLGTPQPQFAAGARIAGEGTLLLDYGLWISRISARGGVPDLFHNLTVKRITKVAIPAAHISQNGRSKAFPPYLAPGQYTAADTSEIETMAGQAFYTEFYILEFDDRGLEGADVRRTYLSDEPLEQGSHIAGV